MRIIRVSDVNKRRICHITTVHHPMDTRIFLRECISLSEKYNVVLFAPAPAINSLETEHRILPFFTKLRWRLLFSHPVLICKLLLSKKAAIYHLHDPELLPLSLLLHFFRCKVIYDIHELTDKDILNKNIPFKKLFSSIYLRLLKLSAHKISFILAEKSYTDHYHNLLEKYTVLLNYPDENSINSYASTNRHAKKLFYIGNLTGNRGMLQMIRLLDLLKTKNDEFHLICVGRIDRYLKKYLKSVPQYSNVKDQIHFKNYLLLTEAIKYSTDCLAGMALYDDLPNHRDSLSTKMLEYMSVGLPVITSDFPLYRNIIEENSCGFCIDPDNTEKLSEAILELYNKPKLAQEMAQNGINAINRNYNWESEKIKLFEIYKNLIV